MNAKPPPTRPLPLSRLLGVCAVLVALTACSRGLSAQSHAAASPPPAPAVPALADAAAPPAAPAAQEDGAPAAAGPPSRYALPDFSQLVDRCGPAVVNVEVVERTPPGGVHGLSPNDPFYDFFRHFGIPTPGEGQRERQPPARGAGSGFIINSDGYILTNTHVVANADEVTVRLTDRREFAAKVIGADERTDVAVIKINATNLPIARLGDPSRIKPGQWVLAIGSPFGFENSATAGIISATSRSVPGENYVPFIQTDVAVNPGNSGGPLFNMAGEVIGINSQIFSRTGGFMGVSFAIPIDVARNVEEQLIRTGHVVRGRIGVTIQDVDAQLAESFGLDRPRGALVSSVEPGGPAAHAGVAAGDVILGVGGRPIERYGELSSAIAAMKPGADATLELWRNGREQNISVRVAELKEQPESVAYRGGKPREHGGDQASALGLTVRPLEPREKEQAGTQGSLLVEEVTGPAQAAEIEPGDIVLGINGKRVHTVRELQEAARAAGKNVALLIQREDAQIFVPLRLP
ncbi:MAG TPA: DegQ family serine endoprotease [Steroidobacteraceae bacterium]|nr:DegQ family serine endoprotease [Steroidobacteraceae bacterium]